MNELERQLDRVVDRLSLIDITLVAIAILLFGLCLIQTCVAVGG